jgi:hypothetical protein
VLLCAPQANRLCVAAGGAWWEGSRGDTSSSALSRRWREERITAGCLLESRSRSAEDVIPLGGCS